MRRFAILCTAVAVVGCAKTENKPDSAAAAAAAAPAPPPAAPALKLSDMAGKWTVVGKNEAGDSTLATYVLTATADTTGWTIKFPNRPVVPMRIVAVAGDSVVYDAGPYESVLRKGVQVTLHGPMRLKDGKLVGVSVAHYSVKGPDSTRTVRFEGTRAP